MNKLVLALSVAALTVGAAGAASAKGLTESQARAALSTRCGNLGNLNLDSGGGWHGVCDAGPMMVTPDGKVAADDSRATFGGLNEGQALAAMNDACSNVSELSEDKEGNWHGTCSSGARMVNKQGQVVADSGRGGLTEDNVRAVANGSCGSVSDLSVDAAGQWSGTCDKGRFRVDSNGRINFN